MKEFKEFVVTTFFVGLFWLAIGWLFQDRLLMEVTIKEAIGVWIGLTLVVGWAMSYGK
jgi:uncharacterized membrane protein